MENTNTNTAARTLMLWTYRVGGLTPAVGERFVAITEHVPASVGTGFSGVIQHGSGRVVAELDRDNACGPGSMGVSLVEVELDA